MNNVSVSVIKEAEVQSQGGGYITITNCQDDREVLDISIYCSGCGSNATFVIPVAEVSKLIEAIADMAQPSESQK